MHAPQSWKIKCGVRSGDVAPMTVGGTLIMRASNPPPEPAFETPSTRTPSLVPFALDLEDYEEPARNGDAMGLLRHRSQFDDARSTTDASFWSGLSAGLATLGMGVAIAFAAFTSEPAVAGSDRSPHVVAQVAARSLAVESPDVAPSKVAPKKRTHRRGRPAAVTSPDGAVATAPAEVDVAPEVTEIN